MQNISSG